MNHGYLSEDVLEKACCGIFGEDFVFRSPILIKENGEQIELTDILVFVYDTLITIQSKSIDLEATDLSSIEYDRVIRKYDKAKNQINRTLYAEDRKSKVKLTTRFGVEAYLPWHFVKNKIGIITINLKDEQFNDPEFRFQLPKKFECHKGIVIHSFILSDFYLLLNEFNSAGDIFKYLEDRQFASEKIIQENTNDLDLLAFLKSKYQLFEEFKTGKYDILIIEPGLWEEYQQVHRDKIIRRNEIKYKPIIVDIIIREFRTSIEYTITHLKIEKQESVEKYFEIIGVFGHLTRMECILLSDIIKKKIKSTEKYFDRYLIFPHSEYAILFLVSNEKDRKNRQKDLLILTGFAAHYLRQNIRFSNIKNIYSFATEGVKVPGRSIDVIKKSINEALCIISENEYVNLFETKNKGHIDEWDLTELFK
jgi:hypothetical protein